jgi:hypothetical protein
MIVSASRRTDIPAFHWRLFMQRVDEGRIHWRNPYHREQTRTYPLTPETVDAIVFWTKAPAKGFLHAIPELEKRGFRFYLQFTINNYPAWLEPNLPSTDYIINAFQSIASMIGPERVLWRYDPIVSCDEMNEDFHLQNIERLARQLQKSTCRLTISFLDFYPKVKRRLLCVSKTRGTEFYDLTAPERSEDILHLAAGIAEIGARYGMKVVTCGEKVDLSPAGIGHGACIDPDLLNQLWNIPAAARDSNQRGACRCAKSLDIGAYNTCRHGCVYCYASNN